MKKLLKIIRIAAIVFAVIFAVTFVFLLIEGKEIVRGQLERVTRKKVDIGYVGLTLPFSLEIKNLNITDTAKIDYISITPSIPALLTGKMVLNDIKLVKPQLTYEKAQSNARPETGAGLPGSADIASPAANPQQLKSQSSPKAPSNKPNYLRLIIKNLNIKNGRIDFSDLTLPGSGIKIIFKDINFHLTNLYIYPKSAVAEFDLKARIPWLEGQEEGKITAKGWVDLFKKDMEATVKIADIDGVYLYPYYANWVDLEKTRLKSAKLNFTSNVKSVDNNMAAECHLELNDIVFRQKPEEEMSKSEKYAAVVMDIFKSLSKGKVVFNFTIKTRMTNPEFNIGYIKTAFEDKLKEGFKNGHIKTKEVLKVPVKVAGRTARTAADLSKAVYNSTFGLVKVLKDTVKVAFSKETQEEQ